MTGEDRLAAGREALAAGRWEEARAAFAAALTEAETPRRWTGWASPCGGWLLRGFLEPDPDRARALARRVLGLAKKTGDVDLELCAFGDLGVSLVAAGREARAWP